MVEASELKIIAPGGGSGCVTIEDGFLKRTPHVIGITHPFDRGGHTKDIRALGFCAPGDSTHRMAVRITDPEIRELFTHRWNLETKTANHINGHRTINEFLALAEHLQRSHSAGIKLLERAFGASYIGRVLPVTDDDLHIRALLEGGKFIDFEDQIDTRTDGNPPIRDLTFINGDGEIKYPRPNEEVLCKILSADGIFLPPTSWWTSLMPILKTPDIAEAIYLSKAVLIWCSNAFTNISETHGYTLSRFARELYQVIGKKIDYALVNRFNHEIPQGYIQEGSRPVEATDEEIRRCEPYVDKIDQDFFTIVEEIGDKKVVRHRGDLVSCKAINFIIQSKLE